MGLRRYADIYTCILLQADQGEGSTPGLFLTRVGDVCICPSKILSKFQAKINPWLKKTKDKDIISTPTPFKHSRQ